MTFRELNESQLDQLSDDELISYVARARDAGNMEAARSGLCIFAFRRFDDLVRFALVRVPTKQDAEDLALQTLENVFEATFNGRLAGEATKFIFRILRRRIADFHEQRKRRGGGDLPLPEERDESEGRGRDAARVDDFTDAVDVKDVVERAAARLKESHQLVVDLYILSGFNAKETAEKVNTALPDLDRPMTDENVHQVAKRFRDALRDELDAPEK